MADNQTFDRGEFRIQTSGHIDRWKSRGGKSQKRERVSRKKMQECEMVEKMRNTVLPFGLWPRRLEK